MKTFIVLSAVGMLVLTVGAITLVENQTAKVFQRLGIPEESGKSNILRSFTGNYFSYPASAPLKKIATGDRAAIVREIAAYAKGYTASEDFKKQYLEHRDSRKPTPPVPPKPMEQQRKELKADLQKSIKETEQTMKSAPPDQKEIFTSTIQMLRDQLKQLDDPNNPMFSKDMEAMLKQGYDTEKMEYQSKLGEWEKEYPVGPTPMIRKWLTEFLEASKDVDFDAKLVSGEGGKMVFANADYEAKPGNWKLCYRAGRDVVRAGRTAAEQWLSELK